MSGGEQEQSRYYADRADSYDEHLTPGDEHYVALEYSLGLLSVLRAGSVLDVGAGTGRAVEFLAARRPDLRVAGVEPVEAMRARAAERGVHLLAGRGEQLPFNDASVDVVMATGVLHHVADPRRVVAEMLRVARRGVLISDANRFGQGRPCARYVKVGLHAAGLWPLFERLRTRGKGYMESAGDGIFYSYSVYDSMPQVSAWADRTFVVPTVTSGARRLLPLVEGGHALLIAAREEGIANWAQPPAAGGTQ